MYLPIDEEKPRRFKGLKRVLFGFGAIGSLILGGAAIGIAEEPDLDKDIIKEAKSRSLFYLPPDFDNPTKNGYAYYPGNDTRHDFYSVIDMNASLKINDNGTLDTIDDIIESVSIDGVLTVGDTNNGASGPLWFIEDFFANVTVLSLDKELKITNVLYNLQESNNNGAFLLHLYAEATDTDERILDRSNFNLSLPLKDVGAILALIRVEGGIYNALDYSEGFLYHHSNAVSLVKDILASEEETQNPPQPTETEPASSIPQVSGQANASYQTLAGLLGLGVVGLEARHRRQKKRF